MKRWWPLSAEAEDPPLPLYSSTSKTTPNTALMPVGGRLEKREEVLCRWTTVTFLCVLCFFFWLFSGTLSYLWCDWGCGMSTAVRGPELWRPQGVKACVDGCWINIAPSSIVLCVAVFRDCGEHTDVWTKEFVECFCSWRTGRPDQWEELIYMELRVDNVAGCYLGWLGPRSLCVSLR